MWRLNTVKLRRFVTSEDGRSYEGVAIVRAVLLVM